MNSQTPGKHGSLLKVESELTALREGKATSRTFEGLNRKCKAWIRRFGRRLSPQDSEDAVAQSICEELEKILDPSIPIEDACRSLQRALNRNRARSRKSAAQYRDYGLSEEFAVAVARFQEVDMEAHLDEKSAYEYMLEVVEFLRGFILLAVELLPTRDYAILDSLYGFAEFGLTPRGESPLPHLKPNARKVAVHRARQKLGEVIGDLLQDASKVNDKDRKILEDAVKLMHEGHLLDVLAVHQRKLRR